MIRRLRLRCLLALLLGFALVPLGAVIARADSLPADYSGSAHADTLALDVNLGGIGLAASIGDSTTNVDSSAAPPSQASSSNAAANAVGLPVGVAAGQAQADDSTPTDSYDAGLGSLNVPGVLSTGVLNGTGTANWAGDAQCVENGPIATSTTTLAGLDLGGNLLGVINLNILHLGTVSTTDTTTLQNGSVVSTSTGNLADASLLNGAVGIQVLTNPTLTATSDGTTGTVTANDYAVAVTVAGVTTTLHAGASIPIDINLGVADANLTLTVGQLNDTSSGATGSGNASFLHISGTVSAVLVGTLASVDISLLPLNATATAPTGGVQCDVLDPPVITSPTTGATTGQTPTITGTGLPGSTVTVTDSDGTTIGTTTVGDDGTWSLTPADPLPAGDHTISATQALGEATSTPSNAVDFTVVDTTPPDPPVITTPADGSTTNDPTPAITGTAEPGSTVTVTTDDGTVLGTAPVDADGNWSLTSSALADGDHTITATATDPSGNVSDPSDPDTFTVDETPPDAPVITTPADGSSINDATPTISGTGEPGATVAVSVDGTPVGTATVDSNGNWSVPDTTALDDGSHAVTAIQTDAAGNTSPPATSTFDVDTAAPATPDIVTPTDGSSTSDATPTVSGTAEPGSTVTVTADDGTVLGRATADDSGNWSFNSNSLDDGTYTITAVATDAAGNSSPASDPVTFTVDTTAPDAPAITAPDDGSATNDPTPTVTGTGEPGATVTVTVDGTDVGTTTVGDDGTWSLPVPDPLSDGDHTVTATQTDAAGNTSPASDPVTFTVDTTAPDAPAVTGPADGATVGDPTPTITGTGEPGATVTVTVDGTDVGTATVGDDGTWSLPVPDPLSDGVHSVTATQTDAAGNTSPASDPVMFTVDTTAPDAPAVTGPADGSTVSDTTPTIVGTGEPGATVTVTVDGTDVGTTTVGDDGTWSLPVPDPLSDGDHTVTATQTDAAGNTSPASDPVTFTVDSTPPLAPVISTPADDAVTTDPTPTVTGTGEPGETVTVTDSDGTVLGTATVDDAGNWSLTSTDLADGTHTITATQVDTAGNTSPASDSVIFTVDTTAPDAPAVTSPTDGSVTGDNTPTVTGTGEPGDTVAVIIDGTQVGTTTVAGDGTWTLPLTDALPDGDHTVTSTQTDPAGNTSPASDPVTFTVDTTPSAPPAITSPADGSATNDPTPTITGTGTPGETVTVSVDGQPIGTTTVGDDGTFSLTPTTPLTDADHTITATQTDAAGNTSDPSDPVNITVDGTPPDAPVVTAPTDGSVTADPTPVITGTAEPGSTVAVSVDGTQIGTTTAGADGTYTLTPTDPLPDGDHTVTATATDPAGNTSDASPGVGFTVDTTAPDAPAVTGPADGSTVASGSPLITGTGEPGAIVTVTVDGTVVGTTEVNDDGDWSLPATGLADGDHTVTASQTDAAGNTSDPSGPTTFTVDTTAPDAPTITGPADGSATNDPTPTITGTGEPGATVTVMVDGTDVGTATVGADGTWSLTPTDPLPDGDHSITATQTDPAGNLSDPSDPVEVTVDTQVAAPMIQGPTDGSSTDVNTPTISGTGEPGATVTVTTADGTRLGTATVDDSGNWSLVSDQLADGTYTIRATQTDAAGNTSPASDPVSFTVDTRAPAAPVITGPSNGSATNDPTSTIGGTGEPGATVTVSVDGNPKGTAVVGDDGTWQLELPDPLPDGDHTATATQTDPAGNTSPASDPVDFTVDTQAPAAPMIAGPADGTTLTTSTPTISGTGEPGATVTVTDELGDIIGTATVGDDGTWSVVSSPLLDGDHTITATQTDAAGNTSPASDPVSFTLDTIAPAPPGVTGPADGSVIASSTPTITGNGEPGSTVDVIVDGHDLGVTPVNADGTWSIPVTTALGDGDHTVQAVDTDPAGLASDPTTVVFTVDTQPPAAPVITTPADGDVSDDSTPTVSGTAEEGADVVVTDENGDEVGEATADDNGAWSMESVDLPDGTHTFTAIATDPAGNTSARSDPVTFAVDTAPPATPVITSPVDGSVTTDPTPKVTGTGDPGSMIELLDDSVDVASTPVGSNGTWQVTLPDQTCAEHTLTAVQGMTPALAGGALARTTRAAQVTDPQTSRPVTFTVSCPPAGGGTGVGGPNPGAPSGGAPSGGQAGGQTSGGNGTGATLPNTGAPGSLLPLTGIAFLALLSGTALVARRRRQHPATGTGPDTGAPS